MPSTSPPAAFEPEINRLDGDWTAIQKKAYWLGAGLI
jgi:hypothetical protein